MTYILVAAILVILMLLYFRVAESFDIVDRPNVRSSHSRITIRGAGIIFVLAMILDYVIYPQYALPVLGACMIGTISFIDDRITLSSKIRILVHLGAVSILFYYLNLFGSYPWWGILAIYVLVIGIINAYNFMDGINGITGLYSLVVLAGLQHVNIYKEAFIEADLIWYPMIACAVFLFFNLRRNAKCFAGDVGRVSMAFWVMFLLLKLILQTDNWVYLLFLTVYGVDAILTILHRLILRQNIFDAHRLHMYQILANEQKMPHVVVSVLYAMIQVGVSALVLFTEASMYWIFLCTGVPLGLLYIFLKPKLMQGK